MWENGARQGPGLLKHHGGHAYNGQWKENVEHGYGTLTLAGTHKGDKYVGAFENGIFHGNGIYTFGNGDRYAGSFVQGKQQGSGTFEWINGTVYHGEWLDGLQQGTGSLTAYNLEGKPETVMGDWVEGSMVEGKMMDSPTDGTASKGGSEDGSGSGASSGKGGKQRSKSGLLDLASSLPDLAERIKAKLRDGDGTAQATVPKEFVPEGVDLDEKLKGQDELRR